MKENSFVYRLIKFQDHGWMQLLAGLSFLTILRLLYDGWNYALVIMLAMIGHELGHKLVYWRGKVKAKILFLFPLGMVTMPVNEEENEKSNRLSAWNLAWLAQAGVIINVVLMLWGQCLVMFGNNWWSHLGKGLVEFNGFLCLFNLLPVGGLDGGLLFSLMGYSLKKGEKKQLSMAMVAMAGIVLGMVLVPVVGLKKEMIMMRLLATLGWLVLGMFFSAGVWFKKGVKTNFMIDLDSKTMTRKEVAVHFSLYMALIFISASLLMNPLF